MKKDKIKGFIVGVLAGVTATACATAFARTVDITEGIRVFWDGVEVEFKNALGVKVEPVLIDGTTYVPLRGVSEYIGKEVAWNQADFEVYIGQQPLGETTPLHLLPEEKINRNAVKIVTGERAEFKLKDEVKRCDNLLREDDNYNLYVLNGKYQRLSARAVMPYTVIGQSDENELLFFSVENDGTENLIKKYKFKQTEEPQEININLKGVENLKIKWRDDECTESHGHSSDIALYNINLIGKE